VAGTAGTSAVPTGTAAPGSSDAPRRGGTRLRTGAALAGAGALAAACLAVGLSATGDGGGGSAVLPATLAGLPAQPPGSSGGVAEQLTRRLASEASVADVAVGVYGLDGAVMVVLALAPRTPLTDETAGALTARVLGEAGTQRGISADVRSAETEDGLALVTCSTPQPGTSTCVSVEADRALVVLTSGTGRDPVELTSTVRDEVAGT
jgi:hypothetical protein